MEAKMMDVATARRCVEACATYLHNRDESPRAAKDLREAVAVLRLAALASPPTDSKKTTAAEMLKEHTDRVVGPFPTLQQAAIPDLSTVIAEMHKLVEIGCRFNCDAESACNCSAHLAYRRGLAALSRSEAPK